eukprot:6175869-Pleurochrysis_carterae.AAC.6
MRWYENVGYHSLVLTLPCRYCTDSSSRAQHASHAPCDRNGRRRTRPYHGHGTHDVRPLHAHCQQAYQRIDALRSWSVRSFVSVTVALGAICHKGIHLFLRPDSVARSSLSSACCNSPPTRTQPS